MTGEQRRRRCFVVMPFAPSFDGIWKFVIQPTVVALGDECNRADDFAHPGAIMEDVLFAIKDADYLIADLTGRNANVFYELGIAHALGKQVILTTQDVKDVPFNVAHQRIVPYADNASGIGALRESLKKAIAAIREGNRSV